MHRVWVLAGLLILVPFASAGTESDPEVTDAKDDSVSTNSNLGAGAADLLKAWVEEDETDFIITILLDAPACADSTETIEYRMEMASVAFGVDLFGTGGFCSLDQGDTTATATGEASGATISGDRIIVRVPRSAFGDPADGTPLEGLYVTSKAYVGSPEAWNDSDRAPDDGAGRAYIVGGPIEEPTGPLTTYQNVTASTLEFSANQTAPVSEIQILNWTAPAEFTITVQGNASGWANLTIDMMYPGEGRERNVTVCACTGTFNESTELMRVNDTMQPEGGLVQLRIDLAGFNGTLRIQAAQTPAPTVDEGPEDPDPAPGNNQTDDDPGDGNGTTPPGKDSPLPVFVLIAALLIAARRRD